VAAYVEQFADQVDKDGRQLVDRHGYHQPRTVVTSAGAVEVKAPRVNDKRTDLETGERQRFSSAILPAWARRSPRLHRPRPLGRHYVYLWADGIHLKIRLEQEKARAAITAFERAYGAKFPKAVAKIVDDADVLWSSTTTRRSIGSICARRTPSNLLSRQCV
jgi:hypothetical protein